MYRVFCESYENYKKMFSEDCYRLKISEPFELIVNLPLFAYEREKIPQITKKLENLIFYLTTHIEEYPRVKALLWMLESRGIIGKRNDASNDEELVEQAKLMNSFMKMAYWY